MNDQEIHMMLQDRVYTDVKKLSRKSRSKVYSNVRNHVHYELVRDVFHSLALSTEKIHATLFDAYSVAKRTTTILE